MLVLTLRTDNPQAEIGLFEDGKQLVYETWEAHRQLAETLHTKLAEMLAEQSKQWSDIEGVVAYEGPGSFTGLRIGLSVANALAASYQLPVVGATGDTWIQEGSNLLIDGSKNTVVLPEYGAPVHITQPKK